MWRNVPVLRIETPEAVGLGVQGQLGLHSKALGQGTKEERERERETKIDMQTQTFEWPLNGRSVGSWRLEQEAYNSTRGDGKR